MAEADVHAPGASGLLERVSAAPLDATAGSADSAALFARVAADVVGHGAPFASPYGAKRLLYADWTATGRALHSFERLIGREVLPLYGNTHTTTSLAGLQSSAFRAEAREHVAAAVNARVAGAAEHGDVVLFCGSGATGAIDRLVRLLGLERAGALAPGASLDQDAAPARAVVFVGPHEHHANLLPWRESAATVVPIGEDGRGRLDQRALAAALIAHAAAELRVGCFCAASNVTGQEESVDEVSALLHAHGALAIWDYASAAPHARLDMNPVVAEHALAGRSRAAAGGDARAGAGASGAASGGASALVYKDAAVFSAHKLAGGVGAPGVLIVKRSLLRRAAARAPSVPGGGTVFFVSERDHRYSSKWEEREEGGTPELLGALRCGLACQLLLRLGKAAVRAADARVAAALRAGLRGCANVRVLGAGGARARATGGGARDAEGGGDGDDGDEADEADEDGGLPIVSFVVRAPAPLGLGGGGGGGGSGGGCRLLHHAFVCALLSDLFGVQARGGCACAGPYALRLLGVSGADAARLEAAMLGGAELLRPGFARVSLPPCAGATEIQTVVEAVRLVAAHGWRLLPAYRLQARTAEARHWTRARSFPERRWLATDPFPLHPLARAAAAADGAAAARASSERVERAEASADGWQDAHEAPGGLRQLDEAWRAQLADGAETLRALGGAVDTRALCAALDASGAGGARSADEDAALLGEGALGQLSDSLAGDLASLRWFMWPGEAAALLCETLRHAAAAAAAGGGEAREGAAGAPALPSTEQLVARGLSLAVLPRVSDLVVGPIDPRRYDSGLRAAAANDAAAAAAEARAAAAGGGGASAAGAARARAFVAPSSPRAAELLDQSDCDEPADGEDGRALGVVVDADGVRRLTSRKHPLRTGGGGGGGEYAAAVDSASTPTSATASLPPPAAPPPPPSLPPSAPFAAAASAPPPPPSAVPSVGGWHAPPKKVLKAVWRAVSDWGMIRPGDRVLVGLSGGKDSLLLLHALRQLQLGSPPGHFSLGVCTVDPGTSAFDPRPLVGYVAALGLPMHYVATPIFDTAATAMQGDSICAFCARLKRGALYCAAREHGYNVLALGQHLDDMAESFLMSALYNGLLRTMKGAYRVDARDLRVIRPLMHVRERETRAFAYGCGLPVIADNCPACFEAPKERRHVKKLLAAQEAAFPDTFARLATAMAPLNEPAVSDVLAIVRRREADPRASRARVRAREGGRGVGAGLEDAGPEAQLLGLVALVDEVQPLSAPQRELLAGLGDATLLAELARRQSARRGARAAELRGGKGDEDDDDESGVPTGPCAGGACPLPRRADE